MAFYMGGAFGGGMPMGVIPVMGMSAPGGGLVGFVPGLGLVQIGGPPSVSVDDFLPDFGGCSETRMVGTRTLYHVTSVDAARAIKASGRMLRGSSGLAGGGIYFADSPQDAHRKAHRTGVCVCAARRSAR